MSVSCCYQYPKRKPGCHDVCPDRAAEIAKREEEKEARRAFLRAEDDIGASKKAFRRKC